MIQVNDVELSIQQKTILKDISFHAGKGEMIGLIGPNGSGKTTLLRIIANLLKPSTGFVFIDDFDANTYRKKNFARKLCYVPQDTKIDFDFKAKDIVMMGRHVHKPRFQSDNRKDLETIQAYMEMTYTWNLADQSVLSLSGGQRQLVLISKALAQETPIMLLDEPVSALDIYYQLHILSLLKHLSRKGKTIIVVLHDLNLASRFCDQMLLLKQGEVKAYGNAQHVLTNKNIKETYNVQAKIRTDDVTSSITVTALKDS